MRSHSRHRAKIGQIAKLELVGATLACFIGSMAPQGNLRMVPERQKAQAIAAPVELVPRS
jgi:hypothetical protein